MLILNIFLGWLLSCMIILSVCQIYAEHTKNKKAKFLIKIKNSFKPSIDLNVKFLLGVIGFILISVLIYFADFFLRHYVSIEY